MILYQNNLYKVSHSYGQQEYLVVNKVTNVAEERTTKLPTAIGSAIALELAMNKFYEQQKESDIGKE